MKFQHNLDILPLLLHTDFTPLRNITVSNLQTTVSAFNIQHFKLVLFITISIYPQLCDILGAHPTTIDDLQRILTQKY